MKYTINRVTGNEHTFSCKIVMRDIVNKTNLFRNDTGRSWGLGFSFDAITACPEELKIAHDDRTSYGLDLVTQFYSEFADGLMSEEELAIWKNTAEADLTTWINGSRAYHNIEEFGAPTWYEWRLRNWGCVSNPDKCTNDGNDTLEFEVYGGAPVEAARALSEMFGTDVELSYEDFDDENSKSVCCTFSNGKLISERDFC